MNCLGIFCHCIILFRLLILFLWVMWIIVERSQHVLLETTDNVSGVLSISELNQKASRLLEAGFSFLWVAGEISNFKRYDSGHCYFSLKDQQAQIRCVMFRSKAQQLDFIPVDGMEVEVYALPTIYTPRGDFQLGVEGMRRAGLGALFAAFEQLKARLQAQGLFAAERKRALPFFPQAVGIVTSLNGAALQDILITLRRRSPGLRIIIYPTAVQGGQAAHEIARAIQQASDRQEVDILIVGRGGGSIEDLWAFNEEVVAYSLATVSMPVVSAVGHETDFTIADFVADVRAPTPTAAAELVSPDQRVWQQRLGQYRAILTRHIRHKMNDLLQRVDFLSRQLISPARKLAEQRIKIAHLAWRLHHAQRQFLQHKQQHCVYLHKQLICCVPQVNRVRQQLHYYQKQLHAIIYNAVHKQQCHVATLKAKIEGFNPDSILARGYSLVTDAQGKIIRDAQVLKMGEAISLQLAQGRVRAKVTAITNALPQQEQLPW
jgi:exodeoxyribonuclease VII large subunit